MQQLNRPKSSSQISRCCSEWLAGTAARQPSNASGVAQWMLSTSLLTSSRRRPPPLLATSQRRSTQPYELCSWIRRTVAVSKNPHHRTDPMKIIFFVNLLCAQFKHNDWLFKNLRRIRVLKTSAGYNYGKKTFCLKLGPIKVPLIRSSIGLTRESIRGWGEF